MIPQRMLSSETYGSGLKDRVIACRKRLRLNRALHPATGNSSVNDEVELSSDTRPSVSELNDRVAGNLPESPATSTSVVRLEYRSAFSQPEAEGESMLLVGEQGVGIT